MGAQLLILAAGVGRRFGGLKQLEAVDHGGAALMDYTVFDALRSGFDRVVLVVRRETETMVRSHVESGFGRTVRVDYVHQEIDTIPAGSSAPVSRAKPWGTAHAVLAAADVIDGPFAVANADDYYGAPAIEAIGGHLAADPEPSAWAMVGFAAADTLPVEGAVSRALLRLEGSWMRSIEEVHGMRRHPEGACYDSSEGVRVIDGDSPVSMNLWGFDRDLFRHLDQGWREFLLDEPGDDDEYLLPVAIGKIVDVGAARVRVLPARSRWCGMTSPGDRAEVQRTLAELVADGRYPMRLWG
jgi:hypothetical protein